MKTNVKIELSDEQRNQLAILLDGKTSARKVTRKEVIALCEQHIGGLVGQASSTFDEENEDLSTPPELNSIYQIDAEDRYLLAGKAAGYVRGWNLVKRSKRAA